MKNIQTDLSVRAEIKLYYDLYLPENAATRAPLVIAVHGYGAHKRYMMREARLVAPSNAVIVSLQGPHQHFRRTDDGYRAGFGWLTDQYSAENVALHHKFVLDVIDRLDADGLIDRGGDQPSSVPGKRHIDNRGGVSVDLLEKFASCGIPDVDRRIYPP